MLRLSLGIGLVKAVAEKEVNSSTSDLFLRFCPTLSEPCPPTALRPARSARYCPSSLPALRQHLFWLHGHKYCPSDDRLLGIEGHMAPEGFLISGRTSCVHSDLSHKAFVDPTVGFPSLESPTPQPLRSSAPWTLRRQGADRPPTPGQSLASADTVSGSVHLLSSEEKTALFSWTA